MKCPSCILCRAGYQQVLAHSCQKTCPFPPHHLPYHIFEMVIIHYFDLLNAFPQIHLCFLHLEVPAFC